MATEKKEALRRAVEKMRGSVVGRMHTMPWKPGRGPRGDEQPPKPVLAGNGRIKRAPMRGGTAWTPPEEIELRAKRRELEEKWRAKGRSTDPDQRQKDFKEMWHARVGARRQDGGRKRRRIH